MYQSHMCAELLLYPEGNCHPAEAAKWNATRGVLRCIQSIHGILLDFSPYCYATGAEPSLKSKRPNPPQSPRPDWRTDMQACCQHKRPDFLHLAGATTQCWQHLCFQKVTLQIKDAMGWMGPTKPTTYPSIHPPTHQHQAAKSIIFKCLNPSK